MTKPETLTLPPSLEELVRLSHHRWVVPLVAEISQTGGTRFAVLSTRLEVSGPSLRRAIAAAEQANLVMRNPGYGHPLRPEYLLTVRGESIAPECIEVLKAARVHGWTVLATRKWSLPVLAATAFGCDRYCDIVQALPTSTPRVLTRTLVDLTQAGCIRRTLIDKRPPRPIYSVARACRRLARAAAALAVESASVRLR